MFYRYRTAVAVFALLSAVFTPMTETVGAATAPRVAYTRDNNVYLMTATGAPVATVTNRATGSPNLAYPWYQWSPDGRYLLLVRANFNKSSGSLLLLDARGRVLRTLAPVVAPTSFWPSWAIDRDQIAYISQQSSGARGSFHFQVFATDISGHSRSLFSFSAFMGCGGGTSDPAGQLYWQNTGLNGLYPEMSWSVGQQLAAYTTGCGGSMNVTDLRTGKSTAHNGWSEPVLSARGTLAVVKGSPGLDARTGRVLLVTPRTGRVETTVGTGELPVWTADGGTLYFVQRRAGRVLAARDQFGNPIQIHTFVSSIARARSDGTHVTPLTSWDAYGLGPIALLPHAAGAIAVRIDNDTALWQHRSKNGKLPPSTGPYGPKERLIRIDFAPGRVAHTRVLATGVSGAKVQPGT